MSTTEIGRGAIVKVTLAVGPQCMDGELCVVWSVIRRHGKRFVVARPWPIGEDPVVVPDAACEVVAPPVGAPGREVA